MECFAHAGATAIGVCKSCGKGICRECARDLSFGVACSEPCVARVAELESMSTKAKQIYAVGGRKKMPNIVLIMFVLFGALFLGLGLYNSIGSGHIDIVGISMGSAFLLLSVLVYRQVRAFYRNV